LVGQLERVILDKGLESDCQLFILVEIGLLRIKLRISARLFIENADKTED
jgi:hypothetical protein